MKFIFQISAYNRSELEEQLSRALDKRMELVSRQRLPQAWKGIDWLRSRPKAPDSVLSHHTIFCKICGVVLLGLGVFLIVPGLMEPKELRIPLIAGALSTGMGMVYLFPWRKNMNKRFQDRIQSAAAKLLNELQSLELSEKTPLYVSFTEQGMAIGDAEIIPYIHFNTVVETENLYLLTWNERVTVLQKRDMMIGSHPEFTRLLAEQTGLIIGRC
ncbi:MAG: hypothetical protein E7255_06680 [Lachnospiraceae bacterium]|nr:hypothetical protein [Lachnospiraceae bacterium]